MGARQRWLVNRRVQLISGRSISGRSVVDDADGGFPRRADFAIVRPNLWKRSRKGKGRMAQFLYKILHPDEYRPDDAAAFAGSADDHRDGFIHLSTSEQVAGTLAAHFAAAGSVILLAVDPAALPAEALRFEPSRRGQLFPHLYAALPWAAAVRADVLTRGADGAFALPPLSIVPTER